ncbi:bactericidal permeability-increasing protein-like [Amphiprion ocellaris]|uniref:Bactericidal permeability-increasing protein n=1 Tax=Amphiprion ocellaris TaxID=80972 RepID=A0A3Q1AJY1_AMPOC|nr:bactericidal permeability-increasing protein-like [Amphiprion ocellaris]XP_054866914.1 bactericidal permeability-increasing protein-like [Amphiprion ocellaris]
MLLRCWLALLVALIPAALSTNPGVKVKLTEKGIEYGKLLGMAALQTRLKSIKVPDISGSQSVSPIGKVQYSLTNMQITNIGLPKSEVDLVPGSAVKLSIGDAYISLNGHWRVKYLRFIKDSGSFDLNVNGLTITTGIAIKSDETGRPAVSSVNCAATVGSAKIKFHGGASWLYNLFEKFVDKALRNALQKQICPLVADAVSDLNPHLKTLNVLAKVDQYAEIEYSMVSSPIISNSSIDLSLKGEFYNIGRHQEPPFSPKDFSLPPQINNMLYIGMSVFTANSAAFVYDKAGALSLYITDDMIPKGSPFRLNTRTFGVFIPQIAQKFPGLMMKLLVKTVKNPIITFEPNNVTIQATATVTAYAIQPNSTLSPLFVLNLETSVSANVFVSGMRLAGSVTLNKMNLTLGTSYVGQFQVRSLDNMLQMLLKVVVIPKLNVQLGKGYPLPTIGKMKLVNSQLQVLKDYMLIGTDVQFTG